MGVSLRSLRAMGVVLAVALTLSSCYQETLRPGVCTEIGCSDGVSVHLATMPVGAFTVEILRSGAPNLVSSCDGIQKCGQTVFFEYSDPGAQIRVTTSKGSVTTGVNINYEDRRPNGPDCPPVCKVGVVTVPIPA